MAFIIISNRFQLKQLQTTTTPRPSVNNCREIINNRLQVKWEVQGDYVEITLIGRIREDQYMAFGLSGSNGRPQMVCIDSNFFSMDFRFFFFHFNCFFGFVLFLGWC